MSRRSTLARRREAAGLRRTADDDVAGVREWSKAEIARIREETETRITARKARLETEIEQHAAVIEREIDAVQKTVAAFEDEMAAFFERLLGEEDPSRFATMAENLPEPPSFDGLRGRARHRRARRLIETSGDALAERGRDGPRPVRPQTEDATDQGRPGRDRGRRGDRRRRPRSARPRRPMPRAPTPDAGADDTADPRFAALGLSPDYDAAEAEAFADAGTSDEDIPEIDDDALAARIAGLVPDKDKDGGQHRSRPRSWSSGSSASPASPASSATSAASPACSSVGVSSGPEGEFVFAVGHDPDVVLRDAIPSLPSFQARVTGSSDGSIHVTAHDPESDA